MNTHRASHLTELPQGAAPAWVHLIPAGVFSGRDGRGPYTADPQSILAEFAAMGMPVAIDYEHQGIHAADNGKPAPAAAWIKALEARNGEIWGQVDWTAPASAMIASREYRYLSPVFDHTREGRVLRLSGAGLTNNPNLYLTAIARRQAHTQEQAMNELLQQLIAALNLPAAATPDEVVAQAQRTADSLKSTQAAMTQLRAELGLSDGADATAMVSAMQSRATHPDPARFVPIAEFTRVSSALHTLQTSQATAAATGAVSAAMTAGKVAPGMKPWATDYASRDPAGFEQYLQGAPVIVDAHARLPGTPPASANAKNPLLADAEARAGA